MTAEPSFIRLPNGSLGAIILAAAGGRMDFTLTPEQTAFRDKVRTWLKQNLPKDWQTRARATSDIPRPEAYAAMRDWQRRMYEAGFVGLTWPKEAGGQGLTFMEEMILAEEMALAKAPSVLNILAIGMAGPTIVAYGTDEQKRRYPPKMLSCEEIWCQGYSEPNAGSDLASLQTRAVKDGDHYVVNGQKVWTSLAHVADWMMLLARTDPDAPKHKGITYFLLDMKTPGVTVKPLKQITGDAEFNEVYFDNVRVPESQILGGLNNGWAVGLTTLMYERLALGFGLQVRLRIALDALVDLARQTKRNGGTAAQDPMIRQKLAQMWIDTEAFKYTGARAITKLLKGELPGPEASTGKIMWVEGHQRLQELAMDIEGPYAQLTKGSEWAVADGLWQHTFLRSRANSIEGGTTEIQKNIIGERVLGLPKG
jgi:alkylation response protein AidB-like acyl-CoA dehydrogenase